MPAQSTLRSSFSERKRDDILAGATEVFLEQGYGAASMDAIARAAGVSKRTVYGHFGSKGELFGEIVRERCEGLRSVALPAAAGGRDPEAVLCEFAMVFVELLLAPDALALYRIVIAESGRFPELGRFFYTAGCDPGLDALAAYLRRERTKGTLRGIGDPRSAAELFAEMVRGQMHMKQLLGVEGEPSARDVRRHVSRCVRFFLAATRGP